MRLGKYRHYKGGEYEVLGVAKHSETLEDYVVYKTLYSNDVSDLWVRPLMMFTEKIEVDDGTLVARFTFIAEE